jgi:hypothetical protein
MDKAELEAAVMAAVRPALDAGETVEIATVAWKDMIVPGVFFLMGRRHGVVLTGARLLLIATSAGTGKMEGVAAEYPRTGVRASSQPRGLLMKGFRLLDANGTKLAKFSFPIPNRPEAARLAASLGTPT